MKKRYLWLSLFLLVSLAISQLFFRAEADNAQRTRLLPTFYEYPTEELKGINSTLLIQEQHLEEWTPFFDCYFENKTTPLYAQLRFYTYLYLAQRDAAFLSYNAHQCFLGSLDPLTEKLVKHLFPDFEDMPQICSDPYSEKLADTVLAKYFARIEKEENNTHTFSKCLKFSDADEEAAKWMPWLTPLPRPPPPPPADDTQAWEQQVCQLKRIRRYLSSQQIAFVHSWEGYKGITRYPQALANRYMEKNCVPFAKILLVRSVLMMGFYDGTIASLDAKYTYCSPRPDMRDPSLCPLIPTPDSPSYPSGHAIQGAILGKILAYFFPDDCQYWQKLGDEVGESRLWAGVHFPIDVEEGQILGYKIAAQAIEHIKG